MSLVPSWTSNDIDDALSDAQVAQNDQDTLKNDSDLNAAASSTLRNEKRADQTVNLNTITDDEAGAVRTAFMNVSKVLTELQLKR